MVAEPDPAPSWSSYLALVEELAPDRRVIEPTARLVDDLGLDSLALAELATALMEGGNAPGMEERFGSVAWTEATVASLYEDLSSVPAAPRNQHSPPGPIRLEPFESVLPGAD